MVKVSDLEYNYGHIVTSGDGVAIVSLHTAEDLAGNVVVSAPTSGASFVVDNSGPVFSSIDPQDSDNVNALVVSYTLNEELMNGTITWSRTGGTADAGGSPPGIHTQTLSGSELLAGSHNSITLTNAPTLIAGTVYSIDFNGSDLAGNTSSPVTVINVMHTEPVDLTTGLVAYYPFSGNAKDSTVNGYDGTVNGPILTVDRFGIVDSAYDFDGVDDYIQVPVLFTGDQDPLTYSVWIKLIWKESSNMNIYGEINGNFVRNHFSIGLPAGEAGYLSFEQFYPSGENVQYDYNLKDQENQWVHLIVKKENDLVGFYVNGQLIAELNHTETYSSGAPTIAAIGNRQYNSSWSYSGSAYVFKGVIDDIRIYNRALSEAEITALYQENGWDGTIAPILNNLNISAFDSTTITIDQPTFDTVGNPTPTTMAYVGLDGTISVDGGGVVTNSMASQDVSSGGYTFTGLTAGVTYRIIVVSDNAKGHSVKEVVQSTLIPTFSKFIGGSNSDGAYHITKTNDNHYFLVGTSKSFGSSRGMQYGLKVDLDGNVVWQDTYGGSDLAQGLMGIQKADNSFAIIGNTTETDAWLDFRFTIINTDGSENSNFKYASGKDETGYYLLETSDSGFLMSGHKDLWGSPQVYYVKTNSTGTKLWDKSFGQSSANNINVMASFLDETASGYIGIGYTYRDATQKEDAFIQLLNKSTGTISWSKYFGNTYNNQVICASKTNDNGYILSGQTETASTSLDVWLVKLDSGGNEQWQKTFGGVSDDTIHPYSSGCVKQTSDNGYILLGTTESYGTGGKDFYLIKTDSTGTESWYKTFGTIDDEMGMSLELTNDGGYILVGTSTNNSGDIWLLKVNQNGDL